MDPGGSGSGGLEVVLSLKVLERLRLLRCKGGSYGLWRYRSGFGSGSGGIRAAPGLKVQLQDGSAILEHSFNTIEPFPVH